MRAPALVLLHHRVADVLRDPLGLCVRPERFAAQLRALGGIVDVVPLEDVTAASDRPRVAITFDDGYADNAEVAAPILRAENAPATFFVTTGGLEEGRGLWWDRLEHMVLDAPDGTAPLVLDLGGRPLRADVRTAEGRARAHRELNRRLRVLTPPAIERALEEIAAQLGTAAAACECHRRLVPAQVRSLHDAGFEIGGHTRGHPLLPALDAEERHREIAGCRDDLAGWADAPVTSFAYPFGMPGSFDRGTVRAVREAGFRRACVNVPGAVKRRTRPFLLPRHVVGDWDRETFTTQVEAWLRAA